MKFDTTIRRVRTLQPDVNEEYFRDDCEVINQRQVLNDLRLAISCWEPPQNQFSAFFLDELTISKAVRQIVTAVVVKTQKVRCKIVHKVVPFDGTKLHNDPLPDNLQKLREARVELNFPFNNVKASESILAGEFLSVCKICNGATGIECVKCKGTGGEVCTTCAGGGQMQCFACKGAGEIMVTATETLQCDNCRGKGIYRCGDCAGKKVKKCSVIWCDKGTVPCSTCEHSGKMRNSTILIKETYVKIAHKLFCKNEWVDSTSELATDLAVLQYEDFDRRANPIVPANSSSSEPSHFGSNESNETGADVHEQGVREIEIEMLRDVVPEHLRHDAMHLNRSLADAPTGQAWDLGTRFELRAGFVYHVVVEHLKEPTELFVSGCSNTVTLFKTPQQPKGFGKKLARRLGAFLSDSQVKNPDHVDAVRSGNAFLSDVRLIGPALRVFGLKVSVSPDGYDVKLPTAPKGFDLVNVNFTSDVSGNLSLQSSVLLGDADRDYFTEALLLSNLLPVGQIALQETNKGNQEQFFLVYRQHYETTAPPYLAFLINRLLATAYQIRKSKRLGIGL